jgi:hypothetical protein
VERYFVEVSALRKPRIISWTTLTNLRPVVVRDEAKAEAAKAKEAAKSIRAKL